MIFIQGTLLANLEEDAASLNAYDVKTGCRLHILDDFMIKTRPVPRYSLTWEEYDRKPGTLRSYMKRNKVKEQNHFENNIIAIQIGFIQNLHIKLC